MIDFSTILQDDDTSEESAPNQPEESPEVPLSDGQLADVFDEVANDADRRNLTAGQIADLETALDEVEQYIPRTDDRHPLNTSRSPEDDQAEQVARLREFAARIRTSTIHDTSQLLEIQNGVADIEQVLDSEESDEWPYAFEELGVDEFKGKDVIANGVPYDAIDEDEDDEDADDVVTIGGYDPAVSGLFDDPPQLDIDLEALSDESGVEEKVDGEIETYAGPRVREMIEASRENPEQPLWIGQGTRNGRDAGIEKDILFRHQGIFGVTGYGKSTLLKNEFQQLVNAGYGACFIDPKGDDSEELMEIIPEHRTDDVIWIEPGSSREYVSGFNFLELGLDPDDPAYETAAENLVNDLVSMFGSGDYARMKRVSQSLIRAMNRSEHDFNIIDMYYILADQESRQHFADLMAEEGIDFVDVYLQEIADMDDEKLEPLLGRLQEWVENPIARRLIAFRDSDINIPEAIEEDKIIIVRMGSESEELKGMIGMAVLRRIWATVRSRADMAERERDPFYLFVDEFDNVANEDGTIEKMLSEARSYRLSITFCTQYPSMLPEDVTKAMFVNSDSLISFNPGHIEEAQAIAENLNVDSQTLLGTPNYKVWMQLTLENNELSPAFQVYTFPPYPPVRPREQAMNLVEESLRRYGHRRKTNQEVKNELMYQFGTGVLERQGVAGNETTTGNIAPESDGGGSTDERDTLFESVYAVQIKQDAKREFVPVDDVKDEWERRAGDLGYQSQVANIIEQVPEEFLERERREDGLYLRVTPDGLEEAGLTQDTGSGGSGGGNDHRWVLTKAYEAFTKLGMHCTLPTQEGDEQPDGVADLPPALDPNPREGDTYQDQRERERRLREEEPYLWELTQGQHVSIEAETTTMDKPKQTLHNLRKAVEAGRLCVFALKDGSDRGDIAYWARRGEQIIYGENPDGTLDYSQLTFVSDVDARGNRTFFNTAAYLAVEGETAVRPKTDAEQEGRTRAATCQERNGAVVLEDHEGNVQAELPSVEDVDDPEKADVAAYYEEDDGEYIVRAGSEKYTYGTRDEMKVEWAFIYRPFIPEIEFDRLPEPEDFEFVIFPNDDNDQYDEPLLYERGDLRPLFPDDSEGNVSGDGDADWGSSDSDERDDRHDLQKKVEQDDLAGIECPDCGEVGEGNWEDDPKTENLHCVSCGYMPRGSVREHLRAAMNAPSEDASPATPDAVEAEGGQEDVDESDATSETTERPGVECCESPSLAAQYEKDSETQTGWVCSSCFTEFSPDGEPRDATPDTDEDERDGEVTTDETNAGVSDNVGVAIDQF
ncbi:type IV secretory system conjugative DNA transfer family protein [Halorussus sp. MSC15.2]|uniref:type IV secretory system conjugative DNA transfer family protein n=1 Tax=Halorussus sp. MSC15.2 TaxID=2283638 RepID=UPI0013D1C797|nr:DUF87 domain-containing protein [Halorussus sp. MSC15.2]NEU59222.1 DUF87 domain-containing protein [Halorussus sp. MSC15.2]